MHLFTRTWTSQDAEGSDSGMVTKHQITRQKSMPAWSFFTREDDVQVQTTSPAKSGEVGVRISEEEAHFYPGTEPSARSEASSTEGAFAGLFGGFRRMSRMGPSKTWHHEGPMSSTRSVGSVASQSTEASPRHTHVAPSTATSTSLQTSPCTSQSVLARLEAAALQEEQRRLGAEANNTHLAEALLTEVSTAEHDLQHAQADASQSREDLEKLLEQMKRRMEEWMSLKTAATDREAYERELIAAAEKEKARLVKIQQERELEAEKVRLQEVRARFEEAQKELQSQAQRRLQQQEHDLQEQAEREAQLQAERQRLQEDKDKLAKAEQAAMDAAERKRREEEMDRQARAEQASKLEAERRQLSEERLRLASLEEEAKLAAEKRTIEEEQARLASVAEEEQRAAERRRMQEEKDRLAKAEHEAKLEAERQSLRQAMEQLAEAEKNSQKEIQQRRASEEKERQAREQEQARLAEQRRHLEEEKAKVAHAEQKAMQEIQAQRQQEERIAVAKAEEAAQLEEELRQLAEEKQSLLHRQMQNAQAAEKWRVQQVQNEVRRKEQEIELQARRKKLAEEKKSLAKVAAEARLKARVATYAGKEFQLVLRDPRGKVVKVNAQGCWTINDVITAACGDLMVNPTNYWLYSGQRRLHRGALLADAKITGDTALRLRPVQRVIFEVSPHFSVVP